MKISLNSTIKSHLRQFGPLKNKTFQQQKQENSNVFDCFVRQNLSFGKRAIYMIDYDGNYEKFDSVSLATKESNCSGVDQILMGKSSVSEDKTFVCADKVELENGEVDKKAIKMSLLAFRDGSKQPLYSVDFDGNIQRFNNQAEASKVLGVTKSAISSILCQQLEITSGYAFIKAFDVELRDENGKLLKRKDGTPVYDVKKINKLRESFLYSNRNYPIVKIDGDNSLKLYRSINEACIDMNIKRRGIDKSILRREIFKDDCIFVRLSDVVKIDEFGDAVFDENNGFVIDDNKVKRAKEIAMIRCGRYF